MSRAVGIIVKRSQHRVSELIKKDLSFDNIIKSPISYLFNSAVHQFYIGELKVYIGENRIIIPSIRRTFLRYERNSGSSLLIIYNELIESLPPEFNILIGCIKTEAIISDKHVTITNAVGKSNDAAVLHKIIIENVEDINRIGVNLMLGELPQDIGIKEHHLEYSII